MYRQIAKSILSKLGLQRIPKHRLPLITKQLIKSILPVQPVIIEAGAHDGSDTEDLRRTIPDCEVHAFEPAPAVFRRLENRTKSDSRVHRYNVALGESASTMEMHISAGRSDASSSLLKPKAHLDVNPDVTFDETVSVPVVSLDDWAREYSISRVDFLWLDLQGYELPALRGGTQLLRKVKAIQVEVNLIEVFEGVALYHQVRSWLESQGFKIHLVDFPVDDQGDVLFVR
ncbi:FkbM family methyltransferase [Humisphaera borealis]|uniref:FkbM family methyltransferase n=1 Tax=Humisphaera borealis TaxID=2807512 RepID=A0A7M2X3R2_9BACT|nr:FkbM family methyltransferase [Humisphaera borealis]QOV91410.1 FkbM family methyltransferase [Humisphaera borealis]